MFVCVCVHKKHKHTTNKKWVWERRTIMKMMATMNAVNNLDEIFMLASK